MKNSVIQIPVPCHENWTAMSKQDKGRFCTACSKTVVDFSKHSTQEVITYMAQNEGEKVCGRIPALLLNDQDPVLIPNDQRLSLGRFALALVLVFGNFLFSYGQSHTLGKVYVAPVEQTQTPDTLSLKDSLQHGSSLPMNDTSIILEEPMILGMVLPVEPPVIEQEETTKGEIKIVRKPEE